MEIDFSDYINDAVRILVLLNATKNRKSLNMTENKIKLYDYYLKFPCTMLSDDFQELKEHWNFDEYHAFFHWQPDFIRYRQSLNFLIAKGFIEKLMVKNQVVYKIKQCGVEALDKMRNSYKEKLVDLTEKLLPKVSKLSESTIEQLILQKSNLYLRVEGVKDEN